MKFFAFLIFLVSFLISPAGADEIGFSGTIYFRDGNSVQFNRIGSLDETKRCQVNGFLQSQKVNIRCHEVREIQFSEPKAIYGSDKDKKGTVIVINKEGEQFVLQDSSFYGGFGFGDIHYTFNDSITKAEKRTRAVINNNISHIVIGQDSGELRINPITGQFFPASFNYDPYTGEQLKWVNP